MALIHLKKMHELCKSREIPGSDAPKKRNRFISVGGIGDPMKGKGFPIKRSGIPDPDINSEEELRLTPNERILRNAEGYHQHRMNALNDLKPKNPEEELSEKARSYRNFANLHHVSYGRKYKRDFDAELYLLGHADRLDPLLKKSYKGSNSVLIHRLKDIHSLLSRKKDNSLEKDSKSDTPPSAEKKKAKAKKEAEPKPEKPKVEKPIKEPKTKKQEHTAEKTPAEKPAKKPSTKRTTKKQEPTQQEFAFPKPQFDWRDLSHAGDSLEILNWPGLKWWGSDDEAEESQVEQITPEQAKPQPPSQQPSAPESNKPKDHTTADFSYKTGKKPRPQIFLPSNMHELLGPAALEVWKNNFKNKIENHSELSAEDKSLILNRFNKLYGNAQQAQPVEPTKEPIRQPVAPKTSDGKLKQKFKNLIQRWSLLTSAGSVDPKSNRLTGPDSNKLTQERFYGPDQNQQIDGQRKNFFDSIRPESLEQKKQKIQQTLDRINTWTRGVRTGNTVNKSSLQKSNIDKNNLEYLNYLLKYNNSTDFLLEKSYKDSNMPIQHLKKMHSMCKALSVDEAVDKIKGPAKVNEVISEVDPQDRSKVFNQLRMEKATSLQKQAQATPGAASGMEARPSSIQTSSQTAGMKAPLAMSQNLYKAKLSDEDYARIFAELAPPEEQKPAEAAPPLAAEPPSKKPGRVAQTRASQVLDGDPNEPVDEAFERKAYAEGMKKLKERQANRSPIELAREFLNAGKLSESDGNTSDAKKFYKLARKYFNTHIVETRPTGAFEPGSKITQQEKQVPRRFSPDTEETRARQAADNKRIQNAPTSFVGSGSSPITQALFGEYGPDFLRREKGKNTTGETYENLQGPTILPTDSREVRNKKQKQIDAIEEFKKLRSDVQQRALQSEDTAALRGEGSLGASPSTGVDPAAGGETEEQQLDRLISDALESATSPARYPEGRALRIMQDRYDRSRPKTQEEKQKAAKQQARREAQGITTERQFTTTPGQPASEIFTSKKVKGKRWIPSEPYWRTQDMVTAAAAAETGRGLSPKEQVEGPQLSTGRTEAADQAARQGGGKRRALPGQQRLTTQGQGFDSSWGGYTGGPAEYAAKIAAEKAAREAAMAQKQKAAEAAAGSTIPSAGTGVGSNTYSLSSLNQRQLAALREGTSIQDIIADKEGKYSSTPAEIEEAQRARVRKSVEETDEQYKARIKNIRDKSAKSRSESGERAASLAPLNAQYNQDEARWRNRQNQWKKEREDYAKIKADRQNKFNKSVEQAKHPAFLKKPKEGTVAGVTPESDLVGNYSEHMDEQKSINDKTYKKQGFGSVTKLKAMVAKLKSK